MSVDENFDVVNGIYPIIFCSPESVTGDGAFRKVVKLASKSIVAVAVDEGHCIQKWGTADEKSEAFRESFSKLVELKSILPSETPFIALTATATNATVSFIETNLGMTDPSRYIAVPHKSNIKYFVVKTSTRDPDENFGHIIEELRQKKYKAPRGIIFCRLTDHVTAIFGAFKRALKSDFPDYTVRPFAMFHCYTQEEIQKFIIQSFSDPEGSVRVLIATIAFGMGVDCKDLNIALHYGPPSATEDYFQETGRAGRNGKPSYACIINYPKCLGSKKLKPEMKEYVRNKLICRRKMLLKQFDVNSHDIPAKECCDICESEVEEGSSKVPTYIQPFILSAQQENEETESESENEECEDFDNVDKYRCRTGSLSSQDKEKEDGGDDDD
ncbi:recQ-like DNA helicase blm-1 [Clytia hemisphaerica]|uniref:recQ-like DNA helicase blm-1 n=1 Tax=Clytia hemisphaerica TaxID=252671 RepID=UPI0034D72BAC